MDMGVTSQREYRGGINIGVSQTNDSVQRAGTDGSENPQRLARSPIISVGHMHCSALVHSLNDSDLALATAQGIGQRQIAVTGNANDILTALGDEVLNNDLSASQCHRITS